jgi:hypothetical protein
MRRLRRHAEDNDLVIQAELIEFSIDMAAVAIQYK